MNISAFRSVISLSLRRIKIPPVRFIGHLKHIPRPQGIFLCGFLIEGYNQKRNTTVTFVTEMHFSICYSDIINCYDV